MRGVRHNFCARRNVSAMALVNLAKATDSDLLRWLAAVLLQRFVIALHCKKALLAYRRASSRWVAHKRVPLNRNSSF